MSINVQKAKAKFEARYGVSPQVAVRAPGRVNIIGEHTDYNQGYVLPMAIERETAIFAIPQEEPVWEAYAANFDRSATARLGEWTRNADDPWMDYLVGVAQELTKLGMPVCGAKLTIIGDVPIGAGLSSSASIEMAIVAMFEALGGFTLDGVEAAKVGRRVENEFIGVHSGIMDQFIARMGKAGHALFLDCRTHEFEQIPAALPKVKFVIADTGISRGLAGSKYNERVAECQEAVRIMADALKKPATHLRDFSLQELLACKAVLPDPVFRRARHVITEDARTRDACAALRKGDAEGLGALLNGSDESLRADYEVTCKELDTMTEIARSLPGCFGARMTGAGFGGCTVNLVAADRAQAFADQLIGQYKKRTGVEGQTIISSPAEGAGRITL